MTERVSVRRIFSIERLQGQEIGCYRPKVPKSCLSAGSARYRRPEGADSCAPQQHYAEIAKLKSAFSQGSSRRGKPRDFSRFFCDPIGSLFKVNSEIGVAVVAARAS
jgi:hypothetical protein